MDGIEGGQRRDRSQGEIGDDSNLKDPGSCGTSAKHEQTDEGDADGHTEGGHRDGLRECEDVVIDQDRERHRQDQRGCRHQTGQHPTRRCEACRSSGHVGVATGAGALASTLARRDAILRFRPPQPLGNADGPRDGRGADAKDFDGDAGRALKEGDQLLARLARRRRGRRPGLGWARDCEGNGREPHRSHQDARSGGRRDQEMKPSSHARFVPDGMVPSQDRAQRKHGRPFWPPVSFRDLRLIRVAPRTRLSRPRSDRRGCCSRTGEQCSRPRPPNSNMANPK